MNRKGHYVSNESNNRAVATNADPNGDYVDRERRREALAHAVHRNVGVAVKAGDLVKEAETFRKFLAGEE